MSTVTHIFNHNRLNLFKGNEDSAEEMNPLVGLSWLRDVILQTLGYYNQIFAKFLCELRELDYKISNKADFNSIDWAYRRVNI